MLENCFDYLHKQLSSFHQIRLELTTLKLEYHKLCDVVKLADEMLALLLFVFMSMYILLLCFCFYDFVNPTEDSLAFLLLKFCSLLSVAGILAVSLVFGSEISEKVLRGLMFYIPFNLVIFSLTERFHVTSRRPFWHSKTKKPQPYWCIKSVVWEFKSFLCKNRLLFK